MAVKTIFFAVAFCCLASASLATECEGCTAYTADTASTDCAALKTYIGCIFVKDKTSECTVPSNDLTELKKKTCDPALKGVCKCEADYYKTDLGDNTKICTALDVLETCIKGATPEDTCDVSSNSDETKENLLTFVTARKTAKSCGSTATGCGSDDCKFGGSCPADGNLPCECVDGFTGEKCETAPACANGDCENGGTCPDTDNLPCTCKEGFTGNKCEKGAGNRLAAVPGLLVALLLARIYL